MRVLITLVNLIIIAAVIFQLSRSVERSLRKVYWSSFILRLLAGLALGWVYTYYYSVGDTFSFFNDATKLSALARQNTGDYLQFLWSGNEESPVWQHLVLIEPRSVFLSKLVSVICLLTWDNYWVSALYFAGISFGCSWYVFKTISNFFPDEKAGAAIPFLFFPTIIFWSSGIIKESVAISGLFFLSAIFIRIWFTSRVRVSDVLFSLVALWLVWRLKYYFAAVFIPVVFTSFVVKFILIPAFHIRKAHALLWFVTLIVPLSLASFLHPNFYPDRLLHVIVENYEAFNKISAPQDRMSFYSLEPTGTSILLNAPWALLSGLFRPFIWEAGNALQIIVALENTLTLVLVCFAISGLIKRKGMSESNNRLLLTAACTYVVLLCIFITLSTPNFGTLSRYRIGFLPFALFVIMCKNPLLKPIKSWFT